MPAPPKIQPERCLRHPIYIKIKRELAAQSTGPRNLSLVLTDAPSLSPAVDILEGRVPHGAVHLGVCDPFEVG